jgi:hypothetical protein
VGKTSAVRELLGPWTSFIEKPKWTIGNYVCAAGHYTGDHFDGADRVPYNGARECLAYWEKNLLTQEDWFTVFDGDRFSTRPSLEFVAARCMVLCAHMTLESQALEARRGTVRAHQNKSWQRGRETKARRFFDGFPGMKLEIEAGKTAAELALVVRDFMEKS